MAALTRYARWQLGSRLKGGKTVVPFLAGTKLAVSPGMTGATGNIYCGLHEFEDMAFVLHGLRAGEQFLDVGANIGSYSVLAGGVVKARVLSFEPSPVTYEHLKENIRINDLGDSVTALNMAVGAAKGELRFTVGLDTTNHIVGQREQGVNSVAVEVVPLDEAAAGLSPVLMKVDVEGFETEVIRGATRTLASPSLLGILMELNGSGRRYGYDEQAVHGTLLAAGFMPALYEPFSRKLSLAAEKGLTGNTLYVRSAPALQERLKNAPRHHVNGVSF